MSKIVVTGGAGFIGSHIAEVLAKDHEIVIIDNLDDYYTVELKKKNIDCVLNSGNVTFIQGDVTDIDFLRSVIDKYTEYIFYGAAQAVVRISVKNPFKTNNVNVVGSLNILQVSMDSNVKRVINASSSSVYGKVKHLPFDEKHPTQPVSPYGVSKLAAEHYYRVFYEVYGLPIVSLRYFTVYGPRIRPDLTISIFTEKMLKNKPITIFGDGEQTRDFTYIDDIVDLNIELLNNKKSDGKILNIGGSNLIGINDLVNYLKRLIGNDSEVIYSKEQKCDAGHTLADISCLNKLIGLVNHMNIEDGLSKFVSFPTNI